MHRSSKRPSTAFYEAARARGVPFERELEPQQKPLATSELVLRYLDWGDAAAPLVVLLHGFAQTAHAWDFVALSLADAYRVVSLDQRGHGDSGWAPDGDYSPAAHQRDLDALMGQFQDRQIAMIGLSMGGRNAYVFAARHPERVRALVIVDTGPITMRTGRARIQDFVTLPDRLDSFEEFVQRVHEYLPRRSIEQVRQALHHNVHQSPDGKWTWKYDGVLRDPDRRRAGLTPEMSWSYLRAVRSPTLLIRGADSDILAATAASEIVSSMADCTLVEVAQAGHLVPGDNPAGFIQAVRPWLERHYNTAVS